MPSSWLPTIVERSENGPYIKERDFDLMLARRAGALVQQAGISMDRENLVPSDDDLADRLFEAGLTLFLDVGVYNQSTERRILFEREEVEAAIASAPNEITLGTGTDTVVMRHLDVEAGEPCVVHSGPTGTPTSERYHPLILQSCAQEPLVDCLGAGSVSTYMGRPVIPGSPLEILAARRDAGVARAAVRQAGRPGMHINDVAVPLTCAGKMAAFDPGRGLRPCDALLVTQIPELKTNYDQLSRVAFMRSVDMHIVNLMTPLIGGLGGGAEGTAVVNIASHILAAICYAVSYHDMGHMSLRWSHNTGRMGLWIYALAGQAIARNSPMITTNAIYTRSGLGTAELLWEVAASAIACTPCGVHQMGIGATGGQQSDHTSGLEARFNAEVSHAARHLSRQEANRLALECLRHYEDTLTDPAFGEPFSQLYDLAALEPRGEWTDLYSRVREELQALGLDVENGWKEVRHGGNS